MSHLGSPISQIGPKFSLYSNVLPVTTVNLPPIGFYFIPCKLVFKLVLNYITVKTLFLTILFAGACVIVMAQAKKSVVIGTMIDRPNAILVINPPNGDQGFLLPQLTSAQRLSISPSSPQDDGLMVFDLTEKSFYYWSGTTWIKGLGDNQALSYDAATQKLTLSGNGGQVDLNTLKEIPGVTGNGGKFLTTDGSTLSWANIGAIGDITAIIAGQGLNGGAASGDVNLSVNTDATTISVNGSNQLQLTNSAVTSPKIAANAVNSSHIIDGSVASADVLDNSISTNDLADGSVTSPKIAINAINTTHISTGGNDKILSTDGAGVVTWVDRSSLTDDDQGLNLAAGNILNIDNGTPVDLDALVAGGQITGTLNNLVVADGSITNPKLSANAVNSVNIADGSIATADINSTGNDKVLTTDGAGAVTWADRSSFTDDNQGLTLTAGNVLNIDNGIPVDLDALVGGGQITGTLDNLSVVDGTITNSKLAANAVNTTNITDGSITTADINSTGNDKVLTTDGTGVVTWADRTSFTDDNQNLLFSAITNTLSIDNGISADLNAITATGPQIQGRIDALAIVDGTVTSADIQDNTIATGDLADDAVDGNKLADNAVTSTHIVDGAVASADILDGTIVNSDLALNSVTTPNIVDKSVTVGKIQQGTSNQILATDGAGANAIWINPGTLPSAGDVTGTLGTTTVARIQGRPVNNTVPNIGDALIWNGTAWVASLVTVLATTQYYAVDPLNFQGSSSPITAAVNLPHGATVTGVIVYYQYTLLLGTITVNFSRKEFATGNIQNVSSGGTPLLGLGIQNVALAVNGANDVIDNTTYSYRIQVSFSLPATQELHGIRIQYTK